MTVDCKIILKLLALIRIQEIALNIQKILSYRQRTLLGQIEVIAVITVCVRVSVNNDFRQIVPVVFPEEEPYSKWKNCSSACFPSSVMLLASSLIKSKRLPPKSERLSVYQYPR